jgi:hypothetical protein
MSFEAPKSFEDVLGECPRVLQVVGFGELSRVFGDVVMVTCLHRGRQKQSSTWDGAVRVLRAPRVRVANPPGLANGSFMCTISSVHRRLCLLHSSASAFEKRAKSNDLVVFVSRYSSSLIGTLPE